MNATSTLVLTRSDVEALLSPDDCRIAVEEAFRAFGNGETAAPAVVGVGGVDGGFHIKAGLWRRGRCFFAAKVNGNFAGNAARSLARIQGVVVLSDGDTGDLWRCWTPHRSPRYVQPQQPPSLRSTWPVTMRRS